MLLPTAANRILISGAGPSGLILALSLAKNGIPVRVIDKEPGPKLGEKGAGITPRSLEVHRLLGTLPDILSRQKGIPTVRQHDPADPTKVVKIFDIPTLEPTPMYDMYPFLSDSINTITQINTVILGQPHQERIFISHLEKLGVHVDFGVELRSFEQTDDSVSGEIVRHRDGQSVVEKFNTPWLIGADGAHSFVRKALGLNFLGETHEDVQFVLADLKVKGEKLKFWDRWGSPTTKIVRLRPTGQDDNIVQIMMFGPEFDVAKASASRENLIEAFYEITGRRDILFEEVVWFSRYRPNIRMVDQLRVGRVFIAGDAAHCHSPAGGQGMNSGIQDSSNLAWKLALVYKGVAPPSLLDTYAEERLPILAEMLGKTTELLSKMTKAGEFKRGNDLNQLGVNYRGSSIVYEDDVEIRTARGKSYNDDSETAARPGDRAPDAPGLVDASDNSKAVSICDVFSATTHTVLVFSDTLEGHSPLFQVVKSLPEETVQIVLILPKVKEAPVANTNSTEQFDRVLIDQDGYAYSGYHVDHPSLAIVRPDGVVGARISGVQGVEQYFRRIFACRH